MASKKIQIVGLDLPVADWNQTDETQLDYIKNKPDIPSIEGLATEEFVEEKVKEKIAEIDMPEMEQIQADWNQEDEAKPDYIKNKPDIPSIEGLATEAFVEEKISEIDIPEMEQVQSDWDQTDKTQPDFIKNKPDLETIVAEGVTYTNSEPLLQNVGGILASNHSTGFDKVPINDIITELLYPYTPAVINLFTLDPGVDTKEMNVALTVNKATVRVTKKSKAIESVDLFKGETLLQTKTDNILAQGTTLIFNINETLDGSTDTSYQIKVTESGGTVIFSAKQTYDFVYPYFYGVVDKGVTVDSNTILNFEKVVRSKGDHSRSYTTNNQCPVIAYPTTYGPLKSIIDPQGYQQEWTRSTVTVNNDTTIKNIDYYVYVGSAATATATYKFNY